MDADEGAVRGSDDRSLSNLIHAVHNPLAVIAGYAELLEARDDEATRIEASRRIREAAELLRLIVDDLLTVLAVEVDRLPVCFGRHELSAAIVEALDAVQPQTDAHRLLARPADGEWWVSADAEYLAHILENVLLAAAAYAPEGGDVTVALRGDHGFAEISVTNEGPGLSAEQAELLFERLSSVEMAAHPEIRRTGLELYKVRRLVELHGGSVSASRRDGTGLTFVLRIPLHETEESA